MGSTMFMPKKDILNHSKSRLLKQICYGMGGRAAEELVFGDITSGAASDIKMVTKVARHMVWPNLRPYTHMAVSTPARPPWKDIPPSLILNFGVPLTRVTGCCCADTLC